MRHLALAALLCAPAAVRADVVVSTLRDETLRGVSLTGTDREMVLVLPDGPTRRVAADQIVDVVTTPAPAPPDKKAPPFEVQLTDGSRVRGELSAGERGTLRVTSRLLKKTGMEIVLRSEQVRSIRRLGGERMPARSRLVRIPEKDTAYTVEGARIEGFVDRFLAEGVAMDRGHLPRRVVAYPELAALFVDEPPLAPPAALHLLARLADGSALVVQPGFRVRKGMLHGTTKAGLKVQAPMELVAALGFVGGGFVHLSSLPPHAVERTPFFPPLTAEPDPLYLDFVMPVHFDRSPDGNPIRLDGQRLYRGIGVKPRTELVYRLDPSFKEFRALCGIDDEVLGPGYGREGGSGSVVFSVIVDGEKVFESAPVRGPGKPIRVSVPLQNAREVRLVVDVVPPQKIPGGGRDTPALDNAVWGRPLLIR